DDQGNLVIEPEEAKVIKRIFYSYLNGMSMKQIADSLKADGILTGGKTKNWQSSGVSKILKNEKYMGDALLQKTYTIDFLSKKRVKNNGIMPQYYRKRPSRDYSQAGIHASPAAHQTTTKRDHY